MAWLVRRDNGFYYTYWYEGRASTGRSKKCMKSLKTKNAQRARYAFKLLEEKIYLRKQGLNSLDKMPVDSFIPRLESYLNAHFDNKYTRKKYMGNYKLFVEFLSERFSYVKYLHNIEGVHFVDFKMCEKEKGKSPHTINSEIKSLSKVFKIANELNHIEVMPSNGLSIVRAKKPQVKVYNQDEIRMMLMYAKKDVYLDVIILLLLQAGPRKGEVIHFKWSDFNKETRTLKVSIKDKWAPKHGRERILRLSERLAGKIDNLPRVNEYIFIQSGAIAEGRRFSGSQFKRYVIYKFVNKLGIEGWLHKFRDTYASYSLACGVDIVKVKERLGHNSLKETDKYARAINEVIVDDVKRIFIGESGELQRG